MPLRDPAADRAELPLTKERILIVDDDEDVRYVMRMYLEHLGYPVDEAPDGHRALEMARRRPYQMMFLDYRMPRLDGMETLAEIRRVAPDLKIVFITAMTDDDTFTRIFDGELPIDGFLNKPLLLSHVSRCLDIVLARGGKYLHAF
jgi:CheY-like chemotaxis protein